MDCSAEKVASPTRSLSERKGRRTVEIFGIKSAMTSPHVRDEKALEIHFIQDSIHDTDAVIGELTLLST